MSHHADPHAAISLNNTLQVNELRPACNECEHHTEFVSAGKVSSDGRSVPVTFRCRRGHEHTRSVPLTE